MAINFTAPRQPAPARTRICQVATTLITAVTFVTSLASAAHAEVIIVQTTAPNLRAGAALGDDAKITIPAGTQAIFVLPSGTTRTVSGPFEGKASDLTKGVKANPGVYQAIKRYAVTGGATNKTVGAMRSMRAPSANPGRAADAAPRSISRSLPFSWRTIPVDAIPADKPGDFCVEKEASISLVRERSTTAQAMELLDLKSKLRVNVNFAAGASSAPWPADLTLDPRATYALFIKGRPTRQMRMRFIQPLPAREDTLQVLHGQRCDTQFRAFIRELQTTG